MTFLQRIIWLTKNRDDTITLARDSLCSVNPDNEGYAGLSDVQMMKIYLDCKKLLEYQTLTAVIDDLRVLQRNNIASAGTKENIDFARGLLSGIELVSKRLKILSERSVTKKDSDFDRFAGI